MTTYTTKRAATLAQRLAEQEAENQRRLAAIRAEQDAHDARMAKALADAGPARVAFVEDLLERLGIDPTPLETQRHKRSGEVLTDRHGQPRMTDPDPHEELRMQRLSEVLEQLLGDHRDGDGDDTQDTAQHRAEEAVEHPVVGDEHRGTHDWTSSKAATATTTRAAADAKPRWSLVGVDVHT